MKRDFNIWVEDTYKELLNKVTLKDGVTEDEVKELLHQLYGNGFFHGMDEDMGCGMP